MLGLSIAYIAMSRLLSSEIFNTESCWSEGHVLRVKILWTMFGPCWAMVSLVLLSSQLYLEIFQTKSALCEEHVPGLPYFWDHAKALVYFLLVADRLGKKRLLASQIFSEEIEMKK